MISGSFLRAVQRGDLNEIRSRAVARSDLLYCTNRHGDTPLLVAARHGHVTILEFLADEHDVNLTHTNVDGKTALHEAACSEQLEAVEFLCRRNVKVDCLKRADWTPLMMACTKSRQDVVAALVTAGASISLQNKDGWNSFHIACREGHTGILNYLLDIEPNCWKTVSHNGRTPLHTVALHGRLEAAKILHIRCGYEGDECDSCGAMPLMDACRANAVEMAEFLIMTYKCDVSASDCLGRTPVHHASQTGSKEALDVLVRHEADISCQAKSNGMTPLHYAAKEGQSEIIRCLLDGGAGVNSKDKRGRTALHMASGGGYADCVQTLLRDYNAIDSKDASGQTALDLARNESVAELIRTHSLLS